MASPDAPAPERDDPRILFIARKGSVAGLQANLKARAKTAVYCPPKGKDPTMEGYRRFSRAEFKRLRQELLAGEYDLVICHAPAEGKARTRGFFLKCWLTTAKKWLANYGSLGTNLAPDLVAGTGVPLVVYEWDDTTIIQQKHWTLLDACTAYFKINTPTNLYKAFLFQGARNDDVFNIVRNEQYRKWTEKIRPFSLGTPDDERLRGCRGAEKTSDVFFVGGTNYSRVREEGRRLLQQLKDEGLKVDIPEERLKPEEYFRRMAGAWLAWCPEGAEWDTHRAYEAAMVGTVPLLNYPTIRRYQPMEYGTHAFYYGVEGEHLLRVARCALENKGRLQHMARAAMEHVERYHTHERLADTLIEAGRR